jgi:hypothetical protein
MVRITNNDAGTDDKALALNVQEGEAPLGVNRDTLVDNLNSDQVDGFHADCASGQLLVGVSTTTKTRTKQKPQPTRPMNARFSAAH